MMEHTSVSGKLKKLKKVTFDTRPRHLNFAKKSAFPRRSIPSRILPKKVMYLNLEKIDISGYSFPSKSDDDVLTCARLLPVSDVLALRNIKATRCGSSDRSIKHTMKSHKKFKKHHKKMQLSKKKDGKLSQASNYALLNSNSGDDAHSAECVTEKDNVAVEYQSKLQETIDKITGSLPTSPKDKLSCPVKLPLASPPSSELQGCGLHVKTLGVAFSTGVQAERGFVVDKEVMDSFVAVKINEALYEMKEKLLSVEEQFLKITEEKSRMETVLKEKVEMIRKLSMSEFKPHCEDKAVSTDCNSCNCSQDVTALKKKRKKKKRHIATQTEFDGHVCLQSMNEVSLAPYLHLRSPSPISVTESDPGDSSEESENAEKLDWMFKTTDTCARCHAMRPQVRLLRAIKKNLSGIRPSDSKLQTKRFLSDAVGWNALGTELQIPFTKLFKLVEFLKRLSLDPLLTEKSQNVVKCLEHLLSHLPLPLSVSETLDMKEINKPRTRAVAAYLFGWKLKEVITLVRSIFWSTSSQIFPHYFKAELVQADRIAFRSLTFAAQGMRNKSISHMILNSAHEELFGANPTTQSVSATDWYGIGDTESLSSSSDSEDNSLPPPKRMRTESKGPNVSKCTTTVASTVTSVASQQSPISRIFQGLNLQQLVTISKFVQSRIDDMKSAMGSSANSTSTQSLSSSFHISLAASGIHGRVLCNPIRTVGKFTDLAKVMSPVSTGSGGNHLSTAVVSCQQVLKSKHSSLISGELCTSDSSCSRVVPFSSAIHPLTASNLPGIQQRMLSKSTSLKATKPQARSSKSSSTKHSSLSTSAISSSINIASVASLSASVPSAVVSSSASSPTYVSSAISSVASNVLAVASSCASVNSSSANVQSIHSPSTPTYVVSSSATDATLVFSGPSPSPSPSPGVVVLPADSPAEISTAAVSPVLPADSPAEISTAVPRVIPLSSTLSAVVISSTQSSVTCIPEKSTANVSEPQNVKVSAQDSMNLKQTTSTSCISVPKSITNTEMKIVSSLTTEKLTNFQLLNSQSTQSHSSNSFLPSYTSSSESGHNDLISKLILSRPSIVGATRNDTAVIIKWTFPMEIHTFVSKYTILYSDGVNSLGFHTWVDIGSVDALLLPMAVTLYNVSGGNCGMFALKALFHNGLHSLISEPVII